MRTDADLCRWHCYRQMNEQGIDRYGRRFKEMKINETDYHGRDTGTSSKAL